MSNCTNALVLSVIAVFCCSAFMASANDFMGFNLEDPYQLEPQPTDTVPLIERYGDFINDDEKNPFDLRDPDVIKKDVQYDPVTEQYILTERVGEDYFRAPTYMTFEEYLNYRQDQQERAYFAKLAGLSGGDGFSKREDPMDRIDVSRTMIDRLFGGSTVDIRPQGNIDIMFGVDYRKTDNNSLLPSQRNTGGFNFDMAIQMSMTGKIGEKLNMDVNYNTQSTFDFDRVLKLQYDTDAFSDDEIIKKIEAGNVSLPLRNSLIQGSENLFGLKTELQFGRLRLTAVASQQKSERQQLRLEGGAQERDFEIRADRYDENRNFFLSHYNRDNFEHALERIPQINSQFRITKIEVWVTNDQSQIENNRDIVLLSDLGEFDPEILSTQAPEKIRKLAITNPDLTGQYELPSNESNYLYRQVVRDRGVSTVRSSLIGELQLQQSRDFEKVSARLLNPSEYTFHPELGFVSLNIGIRPNNVVGVAYEYTYNGQTYQVGEFAQEVPQDPDVATVLFVKMLKSTTPRVDLAIWDLMMKNIYGIGAISVTSDDFKLDFFYENVDSSSAQMNAQFNADTRNIPGAPPDKQDNLIELLNLDQLNSQLDPFPDGRFDFVSGLTINTRNGRIMIPKLEPFGDGLTELLGTDEFSFPELYDSTITAAREFTENNRFLIKGSHRSSVSNEIPLNSINVNGTVTVTAGGRTLVEGADFEINRSRGTVTILDESLIASGVPVNVSFEDQSLFSFQTKTMLGLRADYEFNENFNLGATYLSLSERPFTQKVNIGDDPIKNSVYGLDLNYSRESALITRLVDNIPLINTKEPSSINISAEFATLRPGHANAINSQLDEGGALLLDDFEAAVTESPLSTSNPALTWSLASIPTDNVSSTIKTPRFEESELSNDLATGVNRAALSWYNSFASTLTADDRMDPYCRVMLQTDLFPARNVVSNLQQQQQLPILNLNYRPDERGPYNYDTPDGSMYSAGAEFDAATRKVKLKDPKSRWAGIQRQINSPDFEATNVEFLEFWVLNPYIDRPNVSSGKLIIQLGNISEDVMKDSRYFYENGLPGFDSQSNVDETTYGMVPSRSPINRTPSFDVDDDRSRPLQDVGYDGLSDQDELTFFNDYLLAWPGQVRPNIALDPSNDNFVGLDENPNESCSVKYAQFNGPDGNTPVRSTGSSAISLTGTTQPDQEDINRNNTLDESESYFSYEIQLFNDAGFIDTSLSSGRITDSRVVAGRNGGPDATWYRYRVPLRKPDQTVGGIRDFRSIQFIRMYMTEFDEPVILRLAEMQLNRSQWRQYNRFNEIGESCEGESRPELIQDAVGIEENSGRFPFNYVLPNGIQREQSISSFGNGLENERSLSLKACNLSTDCNEVGAFKVVNYDIRLYNRLKMILHAELPTKEATEAIGPDDVEVFIRFGSDLENNYYEYTQDLTFSSFEPVSFTVNSPENIWPEANNIDIDLEQLVLFKRNGTGIYGSDGAESGKLNVRGLPNLADARSLMIGIRVKDFERLPNAECIEIWVNELRVSGLNEKGGIAGLARMDIQLADFGNIAASYNFSSIGYGGIGQQLAQRQREDIQGYDLSANLELGKFLPKSSGVKIPFYIQRSVATESPEYDPFNEDVKLSESISDADSGDKGDIKDRAIDYKSITSVNFTNVRKDRTGDGTPMPWDIENFAVSYSNVKEVEHDPIVEMNKVNTRRVGLTYNYSRKGKFIKPLNKAIKNKKYLGWLKEFNFNPLPNSVGFDTELDRRFGEVQYRAIADRNYYNKYYNWDRNYNLNWDFTKSLKLSYNATNRGVVDEPDETILRKEFNGDINAINDARSEAIWSSLKDFGRTKNYSHNIDASYNLPLKHFPFLDFTNIRAQYAATYSWDAASLNIESLGNSIQNSQRRQLNADFDFRKLYKKIGYLKRVESKSKKSKNSRSKSKRGSGKNNDLKSNKKSSKNKNNSSTKNNTELQPDISPTQDGGKDPVIADTDKVNRNSKSGKSEKTGNDKNNKKDKKKGPREISTIERILVRPLLSIRQVRFTYTRDLRSFVPGFLPQTEYLGLSERLSAPGWKYVTGIQPTNSWLLNAANNEGWISDDEELNQQFLLADRENYDLKLSLEPFKDFKLDVNWSKTKQNTHTSNFKKFDGVEFGVRNPRDIGSYTISYFMANTLFGTDVNELFNEFSNNRIPLSERLANESPVPLGEHPTDSLNGTTPYREGYGRLHSEVVLPAFIAAYSGQNPNSVGINLLKLTPKPNWDLRWNGLGKIEALKNIFSNISITHGYSSNLTINSYNTNSDFQTETFAYTNNDKSEITQNFYSRIDIPDVVIREQFTPLLGINVTTKGGATVNFDYKKSRQLSLSLRESGELRETKSTDYTIGFGQTFKNVNIGFLQIDPGKKSRSRRTKSRNKRNDNKKDNTPDVDKKDDKKDNKKTRRKKSDKPKGSDLNVRVDVSFRDDITITHELDVVGDAIPTRGTKTLRINPSIDYDINDNLNIRFFFDYNSTKSAVNPPYPTINTAGGINLRFKLN